MLNIPVENKYLNMKLGSQHHINQKYTAEFGIN